MANGYVMDMLYNKNFTVGPCSVRLSQLRPVDAPTSTSPTELVERMKYVCNECIHVTYVRTLRYNNFYLAHDTGFFRLGVPSLIR